MRRHSLQARPRPGAYARRHRRAVGPVGARRSRGSDAFINANERESARAGKGGEFTVGGG
jgi:hypothetical protein